MTTNRNQNSLITDICVPPVGPPRVVMATNENGLTADRPSVPLTFIFLANKPIIQTAGLVLVQDSGIKFGVGRSKATFRRRRLGCRMYDDLIMGFLRGEGVQDGDLDRTLGADIVGYTNSHHNSCVRG